MTSLLHRHLNKGGMAIVVTHQDLEVSAGFQRMELAS
jgi:ABC-type transport system involved in cytochrome c biogenesis ATPase subunit